MDEVREATAYHLVFNWHSSEIVSLIIRVAANLRALGYTVVDEYQPELVVLPGNDFDADALAAALEKVDVVIVPNTYQAPHGGRYGFVVDLAKVSFLDGHLRITLVDPSTQAYQLLGHFLTIEGDQAPRIKARACLHSSDDKETVWKLEGQGVTGSPTVILAKVGSANLIFSPNYYQLKKFQTEGHPIVRIEEVK